MTKAATYQKMYQYILLMIYICAKTINPYHYETEKDRTYYIVLDCF